MKPHRSCAIGALPRTQCAWAPRRPRTAAPAGPLRYLDLLGGLPAERWIVRSQAGAPTCVSQAAAACIELMLARREGRFTLLSTRFLDERLRARRDPAEPDGVAPDAEAAKLGEAMRVLEAEGIPTNAMWDEVVPPANAVPGAEVFASARRAKAALYEDRPTPELRTPGLARRVHAELREGRPVAIALPAFREAARAEDETNWDDPDIWRTGIVPDPLPGEVATREGGHAVCIVGFQPSETDALGGWFVFRNSWDTRFGRLASDPGRPDTPPRVPMPGYGVISASHVDAHCWEALSLTL